MKKLLKDLFSEADNDTISLSRIMFFVVMCVWVYITLDKADVLTQNSRWVDYMLGWGGFVALFLGSGKFMSEHSGKIIEQAKKLINSK